MRNKTESMIAKVKDFKMFFIILSTMSLYIYIGGINDVYIQPSENGSQLLIISLLLTIAASWFLFRYFQLKRRLDKNERT